MAKKATARQIYYYAGGEKIELTPAEDLFAIESRNVRSLPGSSPAIRSLTEGLCLVAPDELPASEGLDTKKPKYPVFRSHGAILVALPEVRVEESRPKQRTQLDKWLKDHRQEVTVVSREDDRLVLEPVSGSGEDALLIANDLAEHIHPELAQPRFLRVTPRPNLRGE